MTNLTANEFAVLSTICSVEEAPYAKGDTGSTWTEAKEIANASGLPLKSVIGTLGSLNKKGYIYNEDEVNGRQVDICCISEDGCDALMAYDAPAEEKAEPINASIKLKCAEIRDVAKGWTGTRKEFIADMVHNGVNPATAATQWQRGRSSK